MNVVAEMLREKDQEIQALKADLYWAQLEIAVLAGEDKHSEFVHSIFDGGQRAHLHAWTQESMIRTLKWQLDDLRAQLQFMQIRLDHAHVKKPSLTKRSSRARATVGKRE